MSASITEEKKVLVAYEHVHECICLNCRKNYAFKCFCVSGGSTFTKNGCPACSGGGKGRR